MLIVDLKDIKLASINNKYISKRYVLTKEYRSFKELVATSVHRRGFKPPYMVKIHLTTYKDIDSAIKPVFDALETANVIDNDRNILELQVIKKKTKKGYPESLKVWVDTIEKV